MEGNLRGRFRVKLDNLVKDRDKALRVLTKSLDKGTLQLLFRMSQQSARPDGWKARTLPDGGSPGSDDTTSTERAALFGLAEATDWSPEHARGKIAVDRFDDPRRYQADPVGVIVAEILTQFFTAVNALERLDKKLGEVTKAKEDAYGRQSSLQGNCLCCTRAVSGSSKDRLRGGLCRACDTAYRRARSADEVRMDSHGMVDKEGWIKGRSAWVKANVEPEPEVVHATELDPVIRRALSKVTGGFKRGVGYVDGAEAEKLLPPIPPAVLPSHVKSVLG
jgi:hypothetical protein